MFKKIMQWLIGFIASDNQDVRILLGNERYELIQSLVIEASKLGDMTGTQKRAWVEMQLSDLMGKAGKWIVRQAIERILGELQSQK